MNTLKVCIIKPTTLGHGVYASPGEFHTVESDVARLLIEQGQAEKFDAQKHSNKGNR